MTQADSVHSTPPTNAPVSQNNPVDATTRRRFLSQTAGIAAGGTALALATVSATEGAAAPMAALASSGVDPIFAMIYTHKKLRAEWQARYDRLDEAQFGAAEEHGHRPIELIQWRNHHIGASEIDLRRQTLLAAGEIDPQTVEQEYHDANVRYQAKVEAGVAWDERAGLTTLREDIDRRLGAEHQYAWRLAHTKPATPAGAAALIQYVLDDDLATEEEYWHMTALRSAVAALNSMGAAVLS
jgi:hypothetical protein